MRDFFIDWAERLISVFVVMLVLGVIGAGIMTMFSGMPGGFWRGLAVIVFGGFYALLTGGLMYLFFGIFRNSQETNRLLAELLRK